MHKSFLMIENSENIVLTELKQLFIQSNNNLYKLILHYMKQGKNSSVSYDRLKYIFIPTYATRNGLINTLKSMEKHKMIKKVCYKNVVIYELVD